MTRRRIDTTDQRGRRGLGHFCGTRFTETERVAAATLQADARDLDGEERAAFIASWKPAARAKHPWRKWER